MEKSRAIIQSAALLDDIASGTLTQGDFYKALDEAGNLSGDLCIMVLSGQLNNATEPNNAAIIAAAECLKDLCLGYNLKRWIDARASARDHSENLYRIAESEGA